MRAQNLSDGNLPMWRHGRTWIFGYAWAIEWEIPGRTLGVSLGWLSFSVRLPGMVALYVQRRSESYHRREFSIYWLDGSLWVTHPFEREMEWRSSDPWWRKALCFHVVDWILGRPKCDESKGQPFTVVIPMPEGSYLAIASPERRVWRRRWYFPDKVRESVYLSIPGGIGCSGKGENSWDCGDDGLFGIGGSNVEDAIANAVRSSLKSRRRHGFDSKGTGRSPAIVLNAERFAEENV